MTNIPDDTPLTVGALKAILQDRSGWGKNGESWGQYFKDKWFTPQNLGWLVALVVMGWDQWQDMKANVERANGSVITISADTTKLSERVDEMNMTVETVQTTIDVNREHTKSEIAALKAEVQAQLRITRRDFKDQLDPVLGQLRDIQASVKARP